MLMKRLGWRLVEVEEGKQERLNTFLTKLLSKTSGMRKSFSVT
jgi:hypothetical protein